MKLSKSPRRGNDLKNTISYFAHFGFSPNFREVYTFFPRKISQKQLFSFMKRQMTAKKLIFHPNTGEKQAPHGSLRMEKPTFEAKNSYLYTLPQYGMHLRNRARRRAISRSKLRGVLPYLKVLFLLPVIRFIGISGSVAMENCKKSGDVDLMIVTAPNLLFTGRFLSILLAAAFGVRDPRTGVCLNLFLDERDLAVPPADRSLYTAHEVLQLRPFMDKSTVYPRFLQANRWIRRYLPNTTFPECKNPPKKYIFFTQILQPLELLLKKVELSVIRKNATGHYVSATQLWLFKNNFKMYLKSQ